jgi:hypothetical protein
MLTAITWLYYLRNFKQICQGAQKVCADVHTIPASKFYIGIHENPVEDLVAGNM